ncbi:MAG: hypothetical protein GY874_14980, partial [Desulfobacteraceae bacterium]|nr:hypothetical protein [Desulfobacteraceae bacterium]
MRKIKLSLFLVFLCFFLVDAGYCNEGFNIVLDTKDSSGLKMSFVLQDYAVKTLKAGNQTFSEVNIKGGVKTSEKGFAELPFMHASVSLPATGGIEVEVISTDYQDIELEHPILPSKGTIYRNQNPDDIAYEIARNSIVDQWYPKNLVTFTEPYIFRNIRGSNIYIYPFRYNAVTKTLRIYSKVQVQVKFTSKTGKTNTLRPARQKILPVMNNIYQSMFINYQTSKSRFDNEVGESGDILVICTSRDTDAIQPYIEWKREKGFNVEEEVVETGTNVEDLIASNYAANNNLLYVQLVGDWNDIKSNTMEGGAPMDPMLGCVAGNDSYPELAIGRFSAESSDQVTVQVNKVLAYEQDAGSTGSWYDNALGIGSGLGSGQGDDGEPDYEHIDIIKNEKLLTATHTVVEEVYKTGSASTVGGYVDSGLSLINYCGHGSSNSWGTSGFSSSDVNDLRNGDML